MYWDKGKRIVLTSDEVIAMVCPSESEDGLEFDDSDEDPTINIQDLEPLDSDGDSDLKFTVDRKMILNFGLMRNLILELVQMLLFGCQEKCQDTRIINYILTDIILLWI